MRGKLTEGQKRVLNLAPDPETSVDVTALRGLQPARWTAHHRASARRDPVAALAKLAIITGSLMLGGSVLALCALAAWVTLT